MFFGKKLKFRRSRAALIAYFFILALDLHW